MQSVEKIQNKFIRWLYLKQYGYFVGYPYLYPSSFLRGMVGYDTLELRRIVSLMAYIVSVFVGRRCNSFLLSSISLAVPNNYVRARRHNLFRVPVCRTKLGHQSPLVKALRLLNAVVGQNQHLDFFQCTPQELHRTTITFLEAYAKPF